MVDTLGRPARSQFTSRVRVRLAGSSQILEGEAENISDLGMFVRSERYGRVGTRTLVELLDLEGRVMTRMTARVVRVRTGDPSTRTLPGMALRFENLDPDDDDNIGESLLQRFLRKHGRTPEPRGATAIRPSLLPSPTPRRGPVLGIDLGTARSCAATVRDGVARLITGACGYNAIPSITHLASGGRVLVGHKAWERALVAPERTLTNFKRFLGRPFASEAVQLAGESLAYNLVEGIRGRTAVATGDGTVRLEAVAAHVLTEVLTMTEQDIGAWVNRAVIAVPSNFDAAQCESVREAAQIAKLLPEQLIAEAVAVALVYSFRCQLQRTIVVYDLGGGAFEATVLRIDGSNIRIIACEADAFLGGIEFDERVASHAIDQFEKNHDMSLRESPRSVQRVRFAAERAKQLLSRTAAATIEVPYVTEQEGRILDLMFHMTRETYERLVADLVDRTVTLTEAAIKSAGLRNDDIDDILLVGGQTRSPCIRRALAQRFGQRTSSRVHPDEAVAVGAALAAELIEAGTPATITERRYCQPA